ncbi:MAG: glycosyl hydrolase-related protein [Ruthenibacterium sp.]
MRTAGVLTLHQTPVHATACNLLEQPQEALHIEKNSVHFTIKPYEIKTILVRF